MLDKNNIILCTALILGPSASVVAADNNWSGEAELGIISTTGNTETSTSSFKGKVENKLEQWHHLLALEALQSSNSVSNTAERYLLTAKSDYMVNANSYAFGRFSYEDDRFSGYEYRATETLGYGRHLIKEEALTLNVESGLGVRQSKEDNKGTSSEGLLYLSGSLKWDVSKNAVLTEDLFSEIGTDATITRSVTGLKSQINGDLAMKITYTVKQTSKVPVGIKKTDTETAVTLVYSF